MGKNYIVIAWYRIRHHLFATFFSLAFAYALSILLFFLVGLLYPDYRDCYKKLFPSAWFNFHGERYTIYSGEEGGVYDAIAKSITNDLKIPVKDLPGEYESIGLFDDKDTVRSVHTGGGYENFMKITTGKNSFGLVQQAVINLQDPDFRKAMIMATPLFMERLHVFYRKDIFPGFTDTDVPELSAGTNPKILRIIATKVKIIQVGMVGSCTRIIAGDVMAMIEQQIKTLPGKNQFIPRYKLKDYAQDSAFRGMLRYDPARAIGVGHDGPIDLMFFVGADPTDNIKEVLAGGRYGLISVQSSFLAALNREFKLNLEVADFQKKYDIAKHISTVGTLTSLIASRGTDPDDIQRMLQKIHAATAQIQRAFITLPSDCTALCYAGNNERCRFTLPLAEFGFYKYFEDENKASTLEDLKGMIPFVIAMIGLFFPVLKSVNSFKSVWKSWHFNREIDQLLIKVKSADIPKKLLSLKEKIADYYGDGELSESHFKALSERIESHLHTA